MSCSRCLVANGTLLTGQVFVTAQGGVPPRVVAPISNPPVLAYPDEAIGAVVKLRLSILTLPIPVTVLDVANDPGLDLAWARLLNRLPSRCKR